MAADTTLRGRDFCRARTEAADRWLTELLAAAVGGPSPAAGVALVAVGGYGRGDLCPGSDLDVMLVHAGRKDIGAVADRIWYPIWDEAVGLDHSVRTVKEALAVAEDDLKTALGLLDGRFVAGDPSLAEQLLSRFRSGWERYGRKRLTGRDGLAEVVAERHRRFGEVAFLLEPDLKEGRGGLRDVHALRAAALISPVVDAADPAVQEAEDVLLSVRIELQRGSGKERNVLLLQDQDAVAAALDHADADELMAAVSAAGRTIAWASDDGWRRFASWVEGPNRRGRADRALGPGVVLRDGAVDIAPGTDVRSDPSLALRAGVFCAELGVPLSRAALERLAADVPAPADPWPESCRSALVALLGTGEAAIPVLEALDQRGLLVRLLPEWQLVRGRPQRNAYHRFTVDRHLWEAAANAAVLTRRVARPDLLLVGTLLHDIGKGVKGRDHTEAGMELVQVIGPRMGFAADDVADLVAMVEHHLLLPDVATRRDLDDPRTASGVAAAVGDVDRLELLGALTEADSLATGPSAWGTWKEGLVADLVERVRRVLQDGPVGGAGAGAGGGAAGGGDKIGRAGAGAAGPFPTEAQVELMAAGVLDLRVEGNEVTVVAPDRPGLLARVAGTLALRGVDVRSAYVGGDGAMAVEVFGVEPAIDRLPDWDRVKADLALALDGRLALDSALEERARAYASAYRSRAARPAEARVLFDDDASDTSTVVEVRAPDGVGVLYRITRALAECGLDVRSAKVSTLGHEVVDAFYVRDAAGEKVSPAERRAVEAAVLAALRLPG